MTNQISINQLSHIKRWISNLKIKKIHVLGYQLLLFLEFEVLKSAEVVENMLVTRFDSSERYK
jgi:hypothetical protein